MQALDTTATQTNHRHHHQLVGGGGGDNNNLTHAAHCVSCVFLNEIAMAKHSHTLGHNNNNTNNNLHSNSTSHHSNSNSATSHQANQHNTASTMNTSANHSNNNNNPLAPTAAATTLHLLQHHAPHHLQQHLLPHHQQQQQQHHHHHPQPQQHHQQQPHQYNMNNSSDYSSSTYHIYDQISDLIIIKQQRMERKRQVARRKKLVLLAVLATSLVVGSIYLITRLVASTASTSSLPGAISPADQLTRTPINNNSSDNNNQVITAFDSAIMSRAQWPPAQVALPGGARISQQPMGPTNRFDASQWQQARPPINNNSSDNNNQVITAFDSAIMSRTQWPPAPGALPGGARISQQPMGPTNRFDASQWQQALSNTNNQNNVILCSNRGTVIINPSPSSGEPVAGPCKCQPGFYGDRCEFAVGGGSSGSDSAQAIALCLQHNCRGNGQCNSLGKCQCLPGFVGHQCEYKLTAPSVNLSPVAATVQIDGQTRDRCAVMFNNCNGRGSCTSTGQCRCSAGFQGDDCSQLIERQCDDKIDNDNDGLVDCADSECCSDKACQNSTLCMKSPDPLDILMRKQPSPPTSSFFQRMQFLIEKSQTYSNPKDFNDSTMASKYVDRASVIRGRVTYMKQGITGVKVSVAGQINLGITLTRDNGWFDLMVNGGGAVLVEFRREPFSILQKAVRVPWNEIVLMDNVELSLESQSLSPEAAISPNNNNNLEAATNNQHQQQAPSCLAHNYRLMKPLIMAGPDYRLAGIQQQQQQQQVGQPISITTNQRISINSAQQTISPLSLDSNNNQSISLVYISSRANEFMSTITMQLTPEQVTVMPNELTLIHVRIVVEGNLYEQMFEPQANLTFTYAWNRRNAYRQKSFGLSTAIVSVGYEYFDCQQTIWTTKHVQIAGHDLSISEIGNGWNLNIHHRYNYRDAILQRGDGQNFDLKADKPRKVQPLMGDGYQRQAICPYCDSGSTLPHEQRLYRPQALVSAPDGSLYVGDANLVRRIDSTERTVRTVLELSPQRTPQRYSLALSLADQRLYMVDPERFQVYWIRGATAGSQSAGTGTGGASTSTTGAVPAELAGSAAASASAAQLMNDSGLTNGEESLVPVIGSGTRCAWTSDIRDGDDSDRLANCGDGQAARQAHLIDPRALVFDIRGRMYLADGPNVRMIDLDGKIYTILGNYGQQQQQQHQHQRHHHHQSQQQQQFPCSGEAIPMHKYVPKMPIDLAINPIDETLHVLDDNVVYKVTPDKRVRIVAGQLSHCAAAANKDVNSNRFAGEPPVRATEYSLQSAQSISFNQNGELFISEDDQKQALSRVLIVEPEDDTISLFAGLPIDIVSGSGAGSSGNDHQQQQQQQLQQDKQHISNMLPRVVPSQSGAVSSAVSAPASASSSSTSMQLGSGTTLGSTMSSSSATGASAARANEYKFSSIEAIAIDQRGNLIVADKIQLRLLSIEPDLPQMSSSGEYELVSPDNPNELLVFNRFGHHTATREFVHQQVSSGLALSPASTGASHHHHPGHGHSLMSGHQHGSAPGNTLAPLHHPFQRAQASANSSSIGNSHHQNGLITKYTFTYTVNTSLGQLVSVGLVSSGNKISIYREGPHHQVRMIETAFGSQCKLDISRSGQVHSLSTYGPNRSPCCTCVQPVDTNNNSGVSPQPKTEPARCECMITAN